MDGHELAAAAERLVGCPFRLHGRDPATGLDCIGLLQAALGVCGSAAVFPTGYSVRTGAYPSLPELAQRAGFKVAPEQAEPGDVLFVRPGPGQLHLLIVATRTDRLVEAHAGLGRVVLRPGPVGHPVSWRWRIAAPAKG